METATFQVCKGQSCKTFTVQGNNILVPVLFGVAVGILIAKAIK